MAKIRKEIKEEAVNDRDTFICVTVYVDVNAEGLFTTTLSKEDAAMINSYGVELHQNRVGRLGFFKNETMAGLMGDIRRVLRECLNYRVISQEPVIRYSFDTTCAYCLHNQTGDIVPNGRFTGDGGFEWKEGTSKYLSSYFEKRGFGIKIAARPLIKRIVEYGNGKQKIFYDCKEDWQKGSNMEWLNELTGKLRPEDYRKEINGTEENARFFVTAIKQICRINEQLYDIVTNDKLEEFIQKTLKLEVK